MGFENWLLFSKKFFLSESDSLKFHFQNECIYICAEKQFLVRQGYLLRKVNDEGSQSYNQMKRRWCAQ